MSSAKRALVAITLVACVAAVGAALLIYHWRRPLAGPNAGTEPSLLSQLPPGAPAVAYIDVAALRKLHDSSLATILGLAGETPAQDREYQAFVRETGFDYTRDLDQVAAAFWPSAMRGGEGRTLAVAEGRFDRDKIKAYALRTGREISQGPQTYYEVPGDPAVSLGFLSASRIVISNGGGFGVLTPLPSESDKAAMRERIGRVAGAPIFAVARTDHLPPTFYDPLRSSPQFEHLAHSVSGLMVAAQPDAEIVHVTLDAECDSMANAVELATVANGFRVLGSMALSDPKTRKQMTKQQLAFLSALLGEAKLSQQDRIVRLTLDVTPAMLGEATPEPHAQASVGRALIGAIHIGAGLRGPSHAP